MRSDGQLYLCCDECGEYVNSSEAEAHRCPKPRTSGSNFMETGKALEIVHAMATSLFKQHGEICKPALCPADATTALDTVEDFIVNHCGAETWRCRICGDSVARENLREHLVQHNPNAQDMDAEDVTAQYEQGAT